MRRPLVAGVGVALVLAAMPLAARAVGSPEITLRTPTADQVVVGDMSIGWTYKGFSPSAWVDVEASRGDEPFERIARVRIDDGTPGYAGSTTWSTTADDDAADYTIRLVVPSNKRVRSSAAPVVVDNTAPEATEVERTAPNDAGWNNGDVTVRWACTDGASGVTASDVVATVTDEGTDLTASATCVDNAGHSTTATATGIDIDRAAPSAAVAPQSVGEGVPSVMVVADLVGTASDSLSGVASVSVAFVDAAGVETRRQASCPSCGSALAGWSVGIGGLAPGRYQVSAIATDIAGNTAASAAVEYLLVGAPTVPEVTPPEVEPPDVEVPDVTPPPVEPPPVEAPPVTVPTIPPVTVPST